MTVSLEDVHDLRRRRARRRCRAGTAARPVLRDAGGQEERPEDDDEARRIRPACDEAQEAAEDLVHEARLLEQRLRLVVALGHEREDDAAATNTEQEADHVLYSGENCVQFSAEEVAQRLDRLAAKKNENRIEAMPMSRRMVPWANPRTKKP